MAVLHIIEGFGAGLRIELDEDRVTIGRDAANRVQIGDPKASRVHAEIVPDGDSWLLRDLKSSNGTWDDSGRISELTLDPGTTFRIGRTYIRLEDDEETGSQTLTGDDGEWHEPEHLTTLGGGSQLLRGGGESSLERSNEYLRMLHDLVLRSNDAETREELFEMLDDIAADALEGDRCAVFLPTPDGLTLWPAHERRLRARFGATPFIKTLLTAIRARREPLLCTTEGDLDPSTSMVQAGMVSAMAAPLRVGDEMHAVLYVDRLHGDEPFSREDLEFLAAAANQLAVRLHNCEQVAELTAEVDRLSRSEAKPVIDLLGKDSAMDQVRSLITRSAPTDAPVLVTGESGTGKELVARALHLNSKRAKLPLQVVNCAAMAESLVEATLFGHVKGAFTGADQDRPGIFELADQGTLFLDELGELPAAIQAKLLRVLEQGEVQRLGENLVRKVDVRIIAATNRNLQDEINIGSFREDLYHRLNVITIELPPLRERPGDIDVLIDHFLAESARKLGAPVRKISPDARAVLLRFGWPGNVRQLRNVVERAAILSTGEVIQAADLGDAVCEDVGVETIKTPIVSLDEVEKHHIMRVLDHCGGNKKATAELLGIDRSTLYAKLRQYGAH